MELGLGHVAFAASGVLDDLPSASVSCLVIKKLGSAVTPVGHSGGRRDDFPLRLHYLLDGPGHFAVACEIRKQSAHPPSSPFFPPNELSAVPPSVH